MYNYEFQFLKQSDLSLLERVKKLTMEATKRLQDEYSIALKHILDEIENNIIENAKNGLYVIKLVIRDIGNINTITINEGSAIECKVIEFNVKDNIVIDQIKSKFKDFYIDVEEYYEYEYSLEPNTSIKIDWDK